MTLRIIVNCGPCEAVIGKCLESILSQSVTDWKAYVTVDAAEDHTSERAFQFSDPRIWVKENKTRRYSLHNQIDAIRRSNAAPEDVIVSLDGDDWFATNDALKIILETYQKYGCYVTYGSWSSNAPEEMGEMWPAYPDGTTDFRNAPWLATAVRTWKKWLGDRVSDADLRDDAGEYFRAAEDRAIMLPLLEMAGLERARHIPQCLMIYNQASNHVGGDPLIKEAERNVDLIHGRPPYVMVSP